METATVEKTSVVVNVNDVETARKTRNFVKNLRRDVRKLEAVQKDVTASQYTKRMALAEKVATQRVVTAIETLLTKSTTDTEIVNGVDSLLTELETTLGNLTTIKNDKEASKYKRRRARGEETATSRVLARVQKLQ